MTTTITTRIALAFALTLVCAPAQAADPKPPLERPAGEGVICAWGIFTIVAEVGRQCFPNEDAEFQGELRSSVARIDTYVARNSKITPGDIKKFKREQGHEGAPRAQLCQGDAVAMYQSMKRGGATPIRQATDEMLARAGEPTWGTCL